MSAARTIFCERIATIRSAICDFNLRDSSPNQGNPSHNNSVRIIRNGLAVQCFNIFEDFIKARTGEVLAAISNSGVQFQHLPEDFRMAATVNTIKAIEYQLKFKEASDRISYVQDYSEKISSTKATPLKLANIAFFHSAPNIAKDNFRDALAAFFINKPWDQVSELCSRIGVSAIPAQTVFTNLAQRRHCAAHNANFSVSEVDLGQSLLDATGLALCFDILVSKSASIFSKLNSPYIASSSAILFHETIPLRFIRFINGKFCEIKEKGTRCSRSNIDCAMLVAAASNRVTRENGALILFDKSGNLIRWML